MKKTNLKPSAAGSSWKGRTGKYSAAFEPAEKAERNAPVLTHEVSAPADLFNIYLYLGKEQEKHNKENAVR